jgi:hypothetical protein
VVGVAGRVTASVPSVLAVCLLMLSGCVGRETFDEDRPDDWQQGAMLWAFEGGKSHNGDETYRLRVANESGAPPVLPPQPDHCVAYQDGRHAVGDTCTVFGPGQDTWDGEDILEWTIDASWDGKGQRLYEDVEQNRGGRTVVAFAADGTIVAYWDGIATSPDGSFSSE